jgi:acyl-CoA thioesterase FadM
VGDVGRTSVTYLFEMRADDRMAATGRAVAVLLERPGGKPVAWPEEHRRALLTAGPQPPELLKVEE